MSQKSETSRGKNHCLSATGDFKPGETSHCSGITSPPTSWENLKPELLEKVMAVFPMHVVCRARTVCKTWNHVLSQPDSAAARALTSRHPLASVLIAPKWTLHRFSAAYPRTEWEVLDVAENHSVKYYSTENHYSRLSDCTLYDKFIFHYSGCSYTLPDAFVLDYYAPNANANDSESLSRRFRFATNSHWMRYTLAADGDLVYAIFAVPEKGTRVHVVCNPVRKSLQEIPELPLIKENYSFEHDIVVMSAQSATSSYKIIVMDSYARVYPRSEQVHLYDSTTSVWRTLCELPSKDYCAYSTIFMNGVLFTLFVDITEVPWRRMLFTCDLTTGAWTYVDVELPRLYHPQDKAQLVVSSGRLFLVEYTGLPLQPLFGLSRWESEPVARRTNRKKMVNVSIWEIQLATQKLVRVAEIWNFAKYTRMMLDEFLDPELMVAVGCTDFIVIISCMLGRRVAYDLSKKCWIKLRLPHPIPIPYSFRNGGVFASVVDF